MPNQYTVAGAITPSQRFWANVQKSDTCWLWTAYLEDGYGRFWINGSHELAHRYSYRTLVSPIPEGMTIDHLCRNRACVNPDHLEVVTNRVNVLRGISPSAQHARASFCSRGHPLSGDNLRVEKPYGSRSSSIRRCLICRRSQIREAARRRARDQSDPISGLVPTRS